MHTKSVIHSFLRDRVIPASLSSSLGHKLLVAAVIGTLTACDAGQSPSSLNADLNGIDSNGIDTLVDPASTLTPTEAADTTTLSDDKVTLAVEISTPDSAYELDALRGGTRLYVDRDYVYTNVLPAYNGLCYVRTANDDKYASGPDFLSVNVNKPVTVYIGYDSRNTVLPAWMQSWEDTGEQLVATHNQPYPLMLELYKQDFPAGTVALGGNEMGQANYVVLVEDPESTGGGPCGTPSDAKIVFSWEPNQEYVKGYKLYFGSTVESATELVSDVALTALSFDPSAPSVEYAAWDDLGLYAGDKACFRISAYDDTGESSLSPPICTAI